MVLRQRVPLVAAVLILLAEVILRLEDAYLVGVVDRKPVVVFWFWWWWWLGSEVGGERGIFEGGFLLKWPAHVMKGESILGDIVTSTI